MSGDAGPALRRMLEAGDSLLRKLNSESWNQTTLEVFPEAFEDQHKELSLYVQRLKHPRDVLAFFAKFGGLRDHYFGNREPRTPVEMWERGFGIAVISYDDIKALGVDFMVYDDGSEIEEDGHVEVISGKAWMLELSALARALRKDEVFTV
jgi:hypothetical protein